LLICSFGSGVIACSGSDQSTTPLDAPPPPPDTPSKPPPDAGVTCSQQGTLNVTAPLDFKGLMTPGRVPNGRTQLAVSVVVTFTNAPATGFVIFQSNNLGVFATGKAGRFEQPPATGTYAMDTDASAGFGIDFVDGITHNADGTLSIQPKQVAVLDSTLGGTVRIDTWAPAAKVGGTSTIGATVSNARFKGFNALPNGSLGSANGCDIMVQNFQFKNLIAQWQATPFPARPTAPLRSPAGFDAAALDGAAELQAEIVLDP
jgi:hypothetical protein